MKKFDADAHPVLIGSLPHRDHKEAMGIIFEYTPQIPLWPQLPGHREEGMLLQFLPGMPGAIVTDDKIHVNTHSEGFEEELLFFFEQYLAVTEGDGEIDQSPFAMSPREAAGFFIFLEQAALKKEELRALKGQLTGPITFCTGLVDQNGRALFYNEQVRDAAIKLLALKAQWQTRKMSKVKKQPLIFFDEPGLTGFGSSAFITITREDIISCFQEVFSAVHREGGLAGVHVCGNTEWSILFETEIDIVSFDAYSYFDKLILYPEHLVLFFERGGILASGIVPTSPELIEKEDVASLSAKWFAQLEQLEKIGIAKDVVFAQTLITPSCGTGALSEANALRVLELTREISAHIRKTFLTP